MAQINGVTVRFSDGIKTADYAPPRLYDITANVALEAGDHAETVILEALTLIRRAGSAALKGQTSYEVKPPADAGLVEEPASPPAEQPRRVRRTKAQIEADEKAKRDASASSSGAPAGGANTAAGSSADAAASLDDPTDGDENVIHLPDETDDAAALEDEEDNGLSEFDVPAPEPAGEPVNDADLASAVTKKNGEINNPDAIRELIGSYNPDPTKPFQLRQVPADKRQEFLGKLAALKKAG